MDHEMIDVIKELEYKAMAELKEIREFEILQDLARKRWAAYERALEVLREAFPNE